jgi:hypothetical protein
VTPDEHYTAAEEILASLHDPKIPASTDQETTWALMEAQVHATLATQQPQLPVLPNQPPTDLDMRNALLEYELTHHRDPYGARTRLVHMLAYLQNDSDRESWIKRAAAVGNHSESAFRRWVNARR